jgi:hypothetical protein
MSVLKAEGFDTPTPPTFASGWNLYGSGWVTRHSPFPSGISATSSPNVVWLPGAGVGLYTATWGTADGVGGLAVASCDIEPQSVGTVGRAGITGGGTASTLDGSSSYYATWVNFDTGLLELVLVVAGSDSVLASLLPFPTVITGHNRIYLQLNSPTLAVSVFSYSLSQWLNASGGFQSGQTTAITYTDSTLSGSGYWGLAAKDVGGGINCAWDTWELDPLAGPPGLSMGGRSTRVFTPGRNPRPRGRILVPSLTRTPPNPPTRFLPLMMASPRRLHAGRIYLPVNPGPFAAPPVVHNTPLTGLIVRSNPGSLVAHRKGLASYLAVPIGPTAPPSGPIVGVMRIGGRPPIRRISGLATPGQWLPSDAPPNVPQPWAGILEPSRRREPAPHRGVVLVSPSRTLGPTPDWPAFFGSSSAIRQAIRARSWRLAGTVWLPRSPSLAIPYVSGPTVPPLSHSAMRPVSRRERPRPAVVPAWLGGLKRITIGSGIYYNIYISDGPGQPIDYNTPVATTMLLTWTSSGLIVPGVWGFGVRAENEYGEEQNLDCALTVIFDASGHDITNIPAPPIALRAFATAGAGIRVEWAYPPARGAKAPTGFHAYLGSPSPDYTTPAATVAANGAIMGGFQINIPGLVDGTTYRVGVRAYNASGEEANATTVSVTADGTGPAPVSGLTLTPVP